LISRYVFVNRNVYSVGQIGSHLIALLQTSTTPATVPQHQQRDILIKEAKQQLDASMDVIYHVLQDVGVSTAT